MLALLLLIALAKGGKRRNKVVKMGSCRRRIAVAECDYLYTGNWIGGEGDTRQNRKMRRKNGSLQAG